MNGAPTFELTARLKVAAGALASVLEVALLGALLWHPNLQAGDLTINVAQRNGGLKKAGLGSLFGASSIGNGTPKYYLSNAVLFVSQSQGRIGEAGSNPFSTEAVAPVLRGTGVKMMCRFGDLCYGWPYVWPGYNNFMAQVTNAVNAIKSNYLDVVYAVAWFNEPDTQLIGSDFMSDPLVGGGSTHDGRINWLYTKTCQAIRSLCPDLKIMAPNYLDFRPHVDPSHLTRMQNFISNAVATGTVPDIIGWHSLIGGNPADVSTSLNYYRALEAAWGVPNRPLPFAVEEYGINNGAFEGIPGQMVRYWAEFERAGVDFACMGIYENGGTIGNTLRYSAWDTNPLPNAGWLMMNWYREMSGEYIPVSHSTFDGVAAWDSTNRTLTVLFGGSDENALVRVNGVGALGLGSIVRVRLYMVVWTTNENVANTIPNQGGDPQFEPYNIFDRNLALDANGNIAIPVRRLQAKWNGYRILITPSNSPATYPTKFEAEDAILNHVTVHHGPEAKFASGGAYVGGIDFADSFVCFCVPAPSNGLYSMLVRYAAGLGPASHFITVNGQSQGVMTYAGTSGWADSEMRVTQRLISLVRGMNHIVFSRATNYAELDFIDVRPDVHRYQAKLAYTNNVKLYKYAHMAMVPDYVGGINYTDSWVEFFVFAPVAGDYLTTIAYANGTSGNSTHLLVVNGVSQGSIIYPPTGGWLSHRSGPNATRRKVCTTLSLTNGWNAVRLQKGNSYAELDYIEVTPTLNLTPVIPNLDITLNGNAVIVSWPGPAVGYTLQQNRDLTETNWTSVTNEIRAIGDRKQATVPVAPGNNFFRLFP